MKFLLQKCNFLISSSVVAEVHVSSPGSLTLSHNFVTTQFSVWFSSYKHFSFSSSEVVACEQEETEGVWTLEHNCLTIHLLLEESKPHFLFSESETGTCLHFNIEGFNSISHKVFSEQVDSSLSYSHIVNSGVKVIAELQIFFSKVDLQIFLVTQLLVSFSLTKEYIVSSEVWIFQQSSSFSGDCCPSHEIF